MRWADRVLAIASRVMRQIVREPRTVALIVVVPTAIMGLVAVAMPDQRSPAGLRLLDLFAPALIGAFAMLFAYVLTGVSFLRERTLGTMERLLASPVRRIEIVAGYLLGFLLFGLLQALIVSVFALYVLDVRYEGALWEIATLELIVVVAGVNLGILASAFARNEFQVVQFIPLLVVPQLILGGMFWPVSAMPDYLQRIADFLPLTYAIRGLRAIMLEGASLAGIGFDLGILAAFAVGFSVAAAIVFRRGA